MTSAADAVRDRALALGVEDRLLWLCCRSDLDAVRRPLLESAVDSGPDWDRVVRKGRYHRLLGLLHHHLGGCGLTDTVPAAALDAIVETRSQMDDGRTRQQAALETCRASLDASGLDYLLVKGPTLQPLYPAGVTRTAGDLDFLVHEEDHAAVTATLEEAGFRLQTPVPPGLSPAQTMAYCQTFEQLRFLDGGGGEVELHFRLHNYGPPGVSEAAWDHVARWSLADGSTVNGIALEELFLYLVSHVNLHAFGRILWYYDVAEFYAAWGAQIDWTLLRDRARARRLDLSFHESLRWILQLLWPEWQLDDGLAPLRPAPWRRAWFQRAWRRHEVFALGSWIRPFDASRYYLLGGDGPWRKLGYLWHVLVPPSTWLAAHLGCEPGPALRWRYLVKRRHERRDWSKVTRRDELLRG
jgi:hypothetical protein